MKYNVYINADIGWPISSDYVRAQMKPYAGKPCTVYIHSNGGSVREALDIYQQFIDHGDVTAYVFGLTASAATLIAMGAKKIIMGSNALMLIHQASSLQFVWNRMNKDQITKFIQKLKDDQDMLGKIDNIAANIYATRAGGKMDEFLATMKEAKWLTAKKCLELGLCDEIQEQGKPAKMSEELKQVMMSYSLPNPETAVLDVDNDAEESPVKNAFRKFAQVLGFAVEEKQPEATVTPAADENKPAAGNNGQQAVLTKPNSTIMKTKLETLTAALGVASLAVAENGSVTLDASQAAALDAALAIARNEQSRLKKENDDLKAQVTALQKGDGAKTTKVGAEDNEKEASMTVEERAQAMLDRVNNMVQ